MIKLKFNKSKKINMKVVGSLLALCTIGLVGVTFAILIFESTFQNRFKTSAYNIYFDEEFYNDWGTKKVKIVNEDTTPVVIRVSYNEQWYKEETLEDGSKSKNILNNYVNGEEIVNKVWTDTWKNDFIEGPDGWYYYTKVLNTNTEIQLLEEIILKEDLLKENSLYELYNSYDYGLDFNFESVQTKESLINEAWGLEATISGNNVTWSFN